MSQRKIISLGSSFAVTLPKKWVKYNNLKKGSLLTYDVQKDQTLIYRSNKENKVENELTLLITEKNMDDVRRGIIAGFLNGNKIIRLNSQNYLTSEQQKLIREIAGRFYMMIVKANSRGITLQTILDDENTSIITIIERSHILTLAMCNDILTCITEPNVELLRGTINLEEDIDQMKFLLSRLIRMSVMNPFMASQQSMDSLDCIDYQILVHRIERIGDHLTNMSKNLLEMYEREKKVPESILSVFLDAANKVFNNYDNAVKSFLDKDLTDIDTIIRSEKEIVNLFHAITPLPDYIDVEDVCIVVNLIQIRESIRKISHYSADIAEITIDQVFKKS